MKAIMAHLTEGQTIIEVPEGSATRADILKLVNAVAKNSTLRELRLGGLSVDDGMVEPIAKMLEENRTLTLLSLGQNQITYKGATALGRALAVNKTLECLNLSNNRIEDKGFISICHGLRENPETALSLIAVFGNNITDVGMGEFADVVAHNTSLKRLHLGGNLVTDIGCAKLALALQSNRTTEKLGLVRSQITDVGAQALLRTLERNATLNEVWIDGNQISSRMTRRIELLMKTVDLRSNWAKAVAFCSGVHPKLGARSMLRGTKDPGSFLPSELLRRILDMVYSSAEEYEKYRPEEEEEEEIEDTEAAAEAAPGDAGAVEEAHVHVMQEAGPNLAEAV